MLTDATGGGAYWAGRLSGPNGQAILLSLPLLLLCCNCCRSVLEIVGWVI